MENDLIGEADDNLTKALGAVVLNFAYLEAMLAYSVAMLIDVSDGDIGKIVTAGRPFTALVDLFDALYRHRVLDVLRKEGRKTEAQQTALVGLVKKLNEANERRNRVIHSSWSGGSNTPGVHSRFRFTAKRSKGLERISEQMTTKDVLAVAHFVADVGNEVLQFSQIFLSPIFWLPHWQAWISQWEKWEKSGDLEMWLDWASNLPHQTES